ncbi:hypothetical protein EYZ11_010604 [Aspergillus tanneri]|uniref:Uncharacterized protein n=1 Tax=Aspergillus tanneri TaxID=1220188 RepID=A0A4S3J4Y1_9EURO|nr:hypothetical protein EYZ11_010604 [Aspergillus tanneri]
MRKEAARATISENPRQVFITHIEAKLYLQRHKPGNVDWDNLPLEPISFLKERHNDQFE